MTDPLDTPEPPQRKRNVPREAIFQAWVDRFIDRVVLQPMHVTGILGENQLTDNARARARARGIKSGVHDVYVAQMGARSLWIELKFGSNKMSDAQREISRQLTACGIHNACCNDMGEVLYALRNSGFQLHANADNLATEYQARADAAVRAAEDKAVRPYKRGRPRTQRPSSAQTRRVEAVRGRQMF